MSQLNDLEILELKPSACCDFHQHPESFTSAEMRTSHSVAEVQRSRKAEMNTVPHFKTLGKSDLKPSSAQAITYRARKLICAIIEEGQLLLSSDLWPPNMKNIKTNLL